MLHTTTQFVEYLWVASYIKILTPKVSVEDLSKTLESNQRQRHRPICTITLCLKKKVQLENLWLYCTW